VKGGDGSRREFLIRLSVLVTALGGGAPRMACAMMPRDLGNLTAAQAAGAIRRGDITAEQYAQFCLMRADALKQLNAFITQDPERVLEAARAADVKRSKGEPLGPLHGLPLAIKDNIDTGGMFTTAGTAALKQHRPRADADVLAPLYAAGAILLGKTNLHELAYGYTTNNAAFGTARNPYDPQRIPGGSSGGTAVAVAARIAPAGIGTDTNGSVRVPAALCGIAGLRPTAGRYPGAGIVPISRTRDTAGPMARAVADLVLLDSVITGDASPVEPVPLKGLRLGVARGYFWADLDPEVERVASAALSKLEKAGVQVVELDLAPLPADAFKVRRCRAIQLTETRTDLARYLAEHGSPLSVEAVAREIATPGVKSVFERFIFGPEALTSAQYEAALREYRPALQAAFAAAFREQRVDATIFPLTQTPALPIGQDTEFEVRGEKFSLLYLGRNTDPGSCAGLPGLALWAGMTGDGLPVGIGLDGAAGSDRRLLGIGLSLEQVLGRAPAPAV
jgi:mandelamide amidase